MLKSISQHNIRLLRWFNFFEDFKPYYAIAVLYFQQITGSFALAMAIFSTITIASALLEVPTGVLSDRLGRRKTMILGSITSSASIIFYGLGAIHWEFALIGAVCNGATQAFFSGNNDALLYDSLKQDNNTESYGRWLVVSCLQSRV